MAIPHTNGNAETQLHLNMMTDTLIANLPVDALRAVVRSLVAVHPHITSTFEQQARQHVQKRARILLHRDSASETSYAPLKQTESLLRCMLSSGMVFESLPLLGRLAASAAQWASTQVAAEPSRVAEFLASIDGDLVQAMTAVEKSMTTSSGLRDMTSSERKAVEDVFATLTEIYQDNPLISTNRSYDRGMGAVMGRLGIKQDPRNGQETPAHGDIVHALPAESSETFSMGHITLPRVFSGLWQLSSPAWGSSSVPKMLDQFGKHVQSGFTAFDMADHYGDAELVFGQFRAQFPHKEAIFGATKLCVFNRINVTREMMKANVTERCRRMQVQKLDLLQFHWQYYEDETYLDALRYLAKDDRVGMIGLCNFDTVNMQRVLDANISIYTNQVQFSLVDSRPVERMGAVCMKHNIKLLTYGTLCGGFLSDKWLGQSEPDLYGDAIAITPSQRKYYSMICNWGGWGLLQELLQVLHLIAEKHKVPGLSNVATRWVLDFPYVGAVIVGARMGISDHSDENLASLGWSLDEEDRNAIEEILLRSKRKEMYEKVGDCGAEYRS